MSNRKFKTLVKQCIIEILEEEKSKIVINDPEKVKIKLEKEALDPKNRPIYDVKCPKCGNPQSHIDSPSHPTIYSCTKCGHKWNPGNIKESNGQDIIFKDKQGGQWVYWIDNRDTGGRIYIKPEHVQSYVRKGYKVVELTREAEMVPESGAPKTERVSSGERNKLSTEFAKTGLDGNGRFEKIEQGLSALTAALSKFGFQLGMVSKDMIMGDKGSRNFVYRRVNEPGQDIFTENPEIQNSRIVFSWENLTPPGQPARFEILAYAS